MLDFQQGNGFLLKTFDEAFATVNDQQQTSTHLRNGDIISFGSVKIQFWLAASSQRGLHLRELFVWMLLIFVTLGQFGLIYWLLELN